jgi:hypothetical protein
VAEAEALEEELVAGRGRGGGGGGRGDGGGGGEGGAEDAEAERGGAAEVEAPAGGGHRHGWGGWGGLRVEGGCLGEEWKGADKRERGRCELRSEAAMWAGRLGCSRRWKDMPLPERFYLTRTHLKVVLSCFALSACPGVKFISQRLMVTYSSSYHVIIYLWLEQQFP